MRSRYAGHPFTTPTDEIAAALEDVSILLNVSIERTKDA